MSRYRVIIRPRADVEAMAAFRWIAERSPSAAARWLAGLREAVAKLAEAPERHPLAEDESEQFGIAIRQCLYGKRRGVYRILFTIDEDTISVLAIRHGAQDTIEL